MDCADEEEEVVTQSRPRAATKRARPADIEPPVEEPTS